MSKMKIAPSALILLVLCTLPLTQALVPPNPTSTPSPTPPPTLGPATEIHSAGGFGTYVKILTIQNQSSLSNPINLVFCVGATLIPYCSFGNIGYRLDGGPIYAVNDFINETIVHEQDCDNATVWANVTLPPLAEGPHNIIVYFGWNFENTPEHKQVQRYEVHAYTSVDFTIDTISPNISESSILNQTYNSKNIPLNFSVDESTSWIGYCLDNSANVTIAGNTTISGLSEGTHSLVVYANDTAGNMGKSNTMVFTVWQPTGTTTPSPSSANTPTQQPTAEQSPMPSPHETEKSGDIVLCFDTLLIAVGVLTLAAVIGIVVALRTKKR